jgi:uncharacterized protein (DUF2147 family)
MLGFAEFSGHGARRPGRLAQFFGAVALVAGLGMATPAAWADGPGGSPSVQAADPQGLWLTASGNAVVRVADCGGDLCGQIVGLVLKNNEPMPRGWNGAPQCGLTIFRTAPAADGQPVWSGTVLDPRDGAHYGARVKVGQNGDLRLRGYVALPLFGQTQIWTRYNGYVPSDCRLQAGADQQISSR